MAAAIWKRYAVRQFRCRRSVGWASSGTVSSITAPLPKTDCRADTLWLAGSDLVDDRAVRIKKRQTRDPVGCDLQQNSLSSVPIHESNAATPFYRGR
jgi:hypothetical protein